MSPGPPITIIDILFSEIWGWVGIIWIGLGYEPGEDSDGPDRHAGDNTDDGISNHGHGALKMKAITTM